MIRATLPEDTGIEVCSQDETRIGLKNKITRRSTKRGSRASVPHDQRTKLAYIFGAICPARGVAAALVIPSCDIRAMQWHHEENSFQVGLNVHAVAILGQAGWRTTDKFENPAT